MFRLFLVGAPAQWDSRVAGIGWSEDSLIAPNFPSSASSSSDNEYDSLSASTQFSNEYYSMFNIYPSYFVAAGFAIMEYVENVLLSINTTTDTPRILTAFQQFSSPTFFGNTKYIKRFQKF